MERQLLWALYHRLAQLYRPRPDRYQHTDHWIVLTFLWAVLCDRPVSWACRQENWPREFLFYLPPSSPTMSRRLRTKSVRKLLLRLLVQLQPSAQPGEIWYVDGKPLVVGGGSGDPDARAGRGVGMLAKGYKLYLIYSSAGRIGSLAIRPLNAFEPYVACELLGQLKLRGYLVGDNIYDTNATYDAAAQAGAQLVCSPGHTPTKGLGHRRHSPHRLLGLMIAASPAGRALIKSRYQIDRFFGWLGNRGGGLAPLPNFVRRLHRVRLWVTAKLVIMFQCRAQNHRLAA